MMQFNILLKRFYNIYPREYNLLKLKNVPEKPSVNRTLLQLLCQMRVHNMIIIIPSLTTVLFPALDTGDLLVCFSFTAEFIMSCFNKCLHQSPVEPVQDYSSSIHQLN